MTIVVNEKTRQLFPPSVRRQARLRTGDKLEIKVSGGVITLLPKLPTAEDDYTPEQRRTINAQLNEAEKGPTYGPFTAVEATRFLKAELKARSKKLKKPR